MLDSGGMYGAYLHYGSVVLIVGVAMVAFSYLWSKGKLDWDEAPKMQMMEDED
jgi:hypothetical protein